MTVRYTYGKRKQFKVGVASKIASQRRDALTKEIEETLGARTLSEVGDEEYLGTHVASIADKSWIVGDRSTWSTNGTGEVHSVIILSNDRCAVEYQDGTPPWVLTRTELEKRFTKCNAIKFPRVYQY